MLATLGTMLLECQLFTISPLHIAARMIVKHFAVLTLETH